MTRTILAAAGIAAALMASSAIHAQEPAAPEAGAPAPAGTPADASDGKTVDMSADDPVVARVNGEEIRFSEVAQAQQSLPAQYQQMPVNMLFPQLVEQLVNRRLMIDKGREQNLEDDPEVKDQIEQFTELAIQNAYIDRAIAEGVSEAEIREIYENTVANQEGPVEVRASHILVESAEEANALIEALDGGADFAELAQEHSTGPSGPKGGDLGYFARSEMVEPFSKAAFAMEPGQVTPEPVQTQFGWHVIKVVDKRRQPPPSFEEARAEIEQRLTREFVNAHMAELRADAEIELLELPGPPNGAAPKQ